MSGTFALLAGSAALIFAGLAVTRPNVVHGLIWLVAALLSSAVAYFALGAGFAGAVQILIYAGAIMAVFVFVVMTVDASEAAVAAERARLRGAWPVPAGMILLVLLPLALGLLPVALGQPGAGAATPHPTPARDLGALLFGPWALAVEMAGFVLLAALLGARHLGRRGAIAKEEHKP